MYINKTLEKQGLDEREVKVYLELLKLGEATATKLSEKTNIDRTLVYRITNKLIENGFVSYIIKNNVKYFLAANPEVFLKNLHEKEEQFREILPELKNIQQVTEVETKVEIFRGVEGIRTVLKIILKDKSSYYILGGGEAPSKEIPIITENFLRQAHKEKIKGKLLERKKAYFFVGKNEEYRFIPEEFLTSTSTMIWKNKTVIFVWSKPFYAILIENPEVAESNLANFNYLWKIAKKPSKKDIDERVLKD